MGIFKSSVFCFSCSVFLFSLNANALTGEACFQRYTSMINNDINASFQNTKDHLTEVRRCLSSNAKLTKKMIALGWNGTSTVTAILSDVCKLSKSITDYALSSVSETKYKETYDLMIALKAWHQDLGEMPTERAFFTKMLSNLVEEGNGYKSLITSPAFVEFATAKDQHPPFYRPFAIKLLHDYLFGHLFCPLEEEFTPVTFDDLKAKDFTLLVW